MAYFSKRKEVKSSATFMLKCWCKLRGEMISEPTLASF